MMNDARAKGLLSSIFFAHTGNRQAIFTDAFRAFAYWRKYLAY
jgi:hypothetical protein